MDIFAASPYFEIMSLIPKGEENAIPAGELARSIGTDTRTLRYYIEKMRNEKVCILSGDKGYYLPKDKEEAERWKRKMLRFMGQYAKLAKSTDKYLGA